MVFNNVRDPTLRWPLSVALSVDDGVTWPWVRDLEPADSATTIEEAAQAAHATQVDEITLPHTCCHSPRKQA